MPEVDPRTFARAANDSQAWASRGQPGKAPAGRTVIWLIVVAVVIAVGAGAAAWFYSNGALSSLIHRDVTVEALREGSGASPTKDDMVLINYKGTLADGTIFDQAQQAVFPLEGVIPGFAQAVFKMQKGGKYKVFIPAKLAYGAAGAGPVPPNADLNWEVELIDFRNRAQIEQEMKLMQEQQQQMKVDPNGKKSPTADNAGAPQ